MRHPSGRKAENAIPSDSCLAIILNYARDYYGIKIGPDGGRRWDGGSERRPAFPPLLRKTPLALAPPCHPDARLGTPGASREAASQLVGAATARPLKPPPRNASIQIIFINYKFE